MTGTEIKAWRESLGLTQREFANILGITVLTLNRWEIGYSFPNSMAQKLLAEVKAGMAKNKEVSDGTHS